MHFHLIDAQDAIEELRSRSAVQNVLCLQKIRDKPSLALTSKYQKSYNHYYRVRQQPRIFYDAYFDLLYRHARTGNQPTLSIVLTDLYDKTNQRHLSFASKLIATLDNSAIIYDKNVARLCGLSTYSLPKNGWIEEAIRRYEIIQTKINQEVSSSSWPETEAKFDAAFQDGKLLAPIRKADLLVWATYAVRNKR